MPSPRAITVPTSATSTVTAKLPICSRMILEMSSALMVMVVCSSFASSVVVLPALRSGQGTPVSFNQRPSNPVELSPHAAVVHGAANPSDETPNQFLVHGHRQLDGLAGRSTQAGFKCFRVFRCERRRTGYLRPNDVLVREQTLAVVFGNQRDKIEAYAAGQHL